MIVETVVGLLGAAGLAVWWRSRLGGQSEPVERASPSVPVQTGTVVVSEPTEEESEVLGGFRLLEFLGEGGMAKVYRAQSVAEPERVVALKIVKDEFNQDQDFRRRLEREARVCEALDHPNIVRLQECGEDEGKLYVALELVEGEMLEDKLSEEGLPLSVVAPYFVGLIDGLLYAHEKGVVHRDLKPGNVMVTEDDRVKIMDFGLARSQDGEKVTKTGDAMGTPAYFPPEQITGAEPTPAADQYSLGVMLFEALTGQRPFTKANPLKLLMQHLSDPPPDPLELKPDLSPTCAAIALRMLEKSPERRFSSLLQVKEGLLALERGENWELPSQEQGEEAPVAPPPPIELKSAGQDVVEGDDETIGFQVGPGN